MSGLSFVNEVANARLPLDMKKRLIEDEGRRQRRERWCERVFFWTGVAYVVAMLGMVVALMFLPDDITILR